jgi:hypothetical protein
MSAFHDQVAHQMHNRLECTVMGLGLVRLLQDAERVYEARTTLHCLQNGFKSVAEKSKKPNRESLTANELKASPGELPVPCGRDQPKSRL